MCGKSNLNNSLRHHKSRVAPNLKRVKKPLYAKISLFNKSYTIFSSGAGEGERWLCFISTPYIYRLIDRGGIFWRGWRGLGIRFLSTGAIDSGWIGGIKRVRWRFGRW